jgi:hypothetical protein
MSKAPEAAPLVADPRHQNNPLGGPTPVPGAPPPGLALDNAEKLVAEGGVGSPVSPVAPDLVGGVRSIPTLGPAADAIIRRDRHVADSAAPVDTAAYDVQTNRESEGPGYTLTPKGRPAPTQVEAMNTYLDDLRDTIMNNRGMRTAEGLLSDHAANVLAQIATAKTHLAGTAMTTEATRAGHDVAAQANLDWRSANLEERKRQNDLMATQHQLAREAQTDIAAQKHIDTLIKNHAEYDSNPENPGEKGMNMAKTYFNMWDAGVEAPGLEAPMKQVAERYNAYKSAVTENGKPKTKFTPEEEQLVKARFRKTLSMYPAEKK